MTRALGHNLKKLVLEYLDGQQEGSQGAAAGAGGASGPNGEHARTELGRFLASRGLSRLQLAFFGEGLRHVSDCEEWNQEARGAPRYPLLPAPRLHAPHSCPILIPSPRWCPSLLSSIPPPILLAGVRSARSGDVVGPRFLRCDGIRRGEGRRRPGGCAYHWGRGGGGAPGDCVGFAGGN